MLLPPLVLVTWASDVFPPDIPMAVVCAPPPTPPTLNNSPVVPVVLLQRILHRNSNPNYLVEQQYYMIILYRNSIVVRQWIHYVGTNSVGYVLYKKCGFSTCTAPPPHTHKMFYYTATIEYMYMYNNRNGFVTCVLWWLPVVVPSKMKGDGSHLVHCSWSQTCMSEPKICLGQYHHWNFLYT